MNEKLIRRAAVKYRTWLISQTSSPIQSRKESTLYRLHKTRDKVFEMERWAKLFFSGSLEKIQYDKYDDVEHLGITCPSVYDPIATGMIPDLEADIVLEIRGISETLKSLVTQKVFIKISPKEAIDEIRAIVDSWPDVKFKNNILSVLIANVVLEDDREAVELGSFWIHADLTYPTNNLRIESVDNIESEKGYTHPHVSDNKPCIGAGGLLSKDALCQGRLEDYFRIIESFLRTYNDSSPHEELRGWYDPDHEDQSYCETCEEWRDDECSFYCEGCNNISCEHCDVGNCCSECDNWFCHECCTSCENCEHILCSRCTTSCPSCHDTTCSDCMNSCATCKESYCDSCTSSCTYCSDTICDDCSIICSCCEGYHCKDCVGGTCNECHGDICKECQTTCDGCDKTICSDCGDNPCDHCGVKMCSNCLKGHNCLLAKV